MSLRYSSIVSVCMCGVKRKEERKRRGESELSDDLKSHEFGSIRS